MRSRVLGAIGLMAMASSAWGYQVRAIHDPQGPDLVEGDGRQIVTVQVQHEVEDPQITCNIDVTAAAQQFANPPPSAATPNEDYTPTTASFSFSVAPGQTASGTFDVPVIDDNLVELNQQPFAALVTEVSSSNCVNANFVNEGEDFVPIFDDDEGNVTLAVDQTSMVVNEEAGSVDVGVTLSGTENVEAGFFIDVARQTVAGTATEGEDYGVLTNSSLTFGPDTLTRTVTIPIVDDALEEPTEDFDLVLSNVFAQLDDESPLQVTLTDSTTNVQINDNDGPGELSFANEPYQVNEAGDTATITLRRSGGSGGEFTAFYRVVDGSATDGGDYEQVSGSVTWADGDSEDKTFTVPILDDDAAEGDETVLIRATTDSDFVEFMETTLTIIDDEELGTASFSTTSVSATEENGEVVLTLVRGGSTEGEVSVDYATEDATAIAGEDYVAAAGTVSWADGDGEDKTVIIQLIEDGEEEEAEDFVVNLTSVTGPARLGSNSAITVTIDPVQTRDISEISNLSPNQRALAQWFDQTCPRLGALETLTPDQADLAGICSVVRDSGTDDGSVREALDAINPEELLVSTFNALRLTAIQHGNLSQRLNSLRNGASGVNLTGLSLEVGGQQIAGRALQAMFDGLVGGGASADESPWGRWGAFINGRLASGDQDASENEAGFGFDLYGVTTGVDYRIRQNFILGLSAGFGSVDSDYDDGAGGMDIDSWNAAAYLTYFRDESFYLDALATYGDNEYDSRRQVAFVSGGQTVDRIGRGETDGKQFSLGFGSGWDFNRGPLTFGPHFGAYFFDVDVDGFAETGAGGLNVELEDQNARSLTTNAGGHVSYALLTDWGVLVPNAKVDWVHEFEDNRETLAFRFVNDPFTGDTSDPSPTITLQSNRPDTNYFIWSVGVSAQFIHGFSGFVNYQSYAGYDDVSLDEWSLGARWEKTF